MRRIGLDVQRAARMERGRSPLALRDLSCFPNLTSLIVKGETREPVTVKHLMVLKGLPTLQRISIESRVQVGVPKDCPPPSEDGGIAPDWFAAKAMCMFLSSFPGLFSVSMPNVEGLFLLPWDMRKLSTFEEL